MSATPNATGFLQFPTSFPSPSGFANNYTATADPTAVNDCTQGYGPGSEWISTTTFRVWTCYSNAVGAAVWLFDGVVIGSGNEPSGITTQFGSSTAGFAEEGNVYRQTTAAGVSPNATGSDLVVAFYALPASGFDISGRGVQITAAGSFASNGNTKTIKLAVSNTAQALNVALASATTIATTGTVTTSGGGWQISGNVFKYGAAGSNTQLALHSQSQVGAAVTALQAPTTLTLTENAIIYIAVSANCATTATDVVFNWLEINVMN